MLAIGGLGLTMVGIILGISAPKLAARWGGPTTGRAEARLAARYYASVVLIVVGTAMQMAAAWPT